MTAPRSPLPQRKLPKGVVHRTGPKAGEAGGATSRVLAGITLAESLGGIIFLFVAFFGEPFYYFVGVSLTLLGMAGLTALRSHVWPGPARAYIALILLPAMGTGIWFLFKEAGLGLGQIAAGGILTQVILLVGLWLLWRSPR